MIMANKPENKTKSDVDDAYSCVMVPPKNKILKSQKCKLICEAVTIEGFSRDEHGNDIPNGLKATIPTKIIGVAWPKTRRRRRSSKEKDKG